MAEHGDMCAVNVSDVFTCSCGLNQPRPEPSGNDMEESGVTAPESEFRVLVFKRPCGCYVEYRLHIPDIDALVFTEDPLDHVEDCVSFVDIVPCGGHAIDATEGAEDGERLCPVDCVECGGRDFRRSRPEGASICRDCAHRFFGEARSWGLKLRASLSALEDAADRANGRLGKQGALCIFCVGGGYDSVGGIIHLKDCPLVRAREALDQPTPGDRDA